MSQLFFLFMCVALNRGRRVRRQNSKVCRVFRFQRGLKEILGSLTCRIEVKLVNNECYSRPIRKTRQVFRSYRWRGRGGYAYITTATHSRFELNTYQNRCVRSQVTLLSSLERTQLSQEVPSWHRGEVRVFASYQSLLYQLRTLSDSNRSPNRLSLLYL